MSKAPKAVQCLPFLALVGYTFHMVNGVKKYHQGQWTSSALYVLCYGAYWAWLGLVVSTPLFFMSTNEPLAMLAAVSLAFYSVSTLCRLSLVGFRRLGMRLIGCRFVVLIACGLMALGSLVLIAICQMDSDYAIPLAICAAAVCSVGSVLLSSRWVEGLGGLSTNHLLVLVAFGFLSSAVIHGICSFLPEIVQLATAAFLPCISGMCLLSAGTGEQSPCAEGFLATRKDSCEAVRISPRYLAFLIVGVLTFGLVGSIVRMMKSFGTAPDVLSDVLFSFVGFHWQNAGIALFSLLFILCTMAVAMRKRSILTNSLSRIILGAVCVAIIVPCLFEGFPLLGTMLVVSGSMCVLEILLVSYSVIYSNKTGMPAFVPLNLFYALMEGMSVGGLLITNNVLPVAIQTTQGFMSIVLAIVLGLVLAVLFLLIPAEAHLQKILFGVGEFGEGSAAGPLPAEAPEPFDDEHLAVELGSQFGLTRREREIAILLARGRSLPNIQEKLSIAEGTARTHMTHIYQKLDVHTRQEFIDLVERLRSSC